MNLDGQRFLQERGGRLRQRRERLGWTQAGLGQRCGLHRTFIGSVERGERNVSLLNLRAIARALRIAPAELLNESA